MQRRPAGGPKVWAVTINPLSLFLATAASFLLVWTPLGSNTLVLVLLILWALVPFAIGALRGLRVLDVLAVIAGMIVALVVADQLDGGSGSAGEEILSAVVSVGYLYAPYLVVAHLAGVAVRRIALWVRSLP